MKAIAMYCPKHWPNVWNVFRGAEGFGFDRVYVIGFRGKIRNKRKIDLSDAPFGLFSFIERDEFEDILTKYNPVSMELHPEADELSSFQWPENPLIVLGPEDGSIPRDILEKTQKVKVTMKGHIRCFNVACAGAIAMYDHQIKSSGLS